MSTLLRPFELDAGSVREAPDAVDARSLARIVSDLAVRPETWMERVRLRTDGRWYERLYAGPTHDVWAISWMPGQGTGLHDHGGSSGAFCVVTGVLEERRPAEDPRVLRAGDVQAVEQGQVHDVHNASAAPAISLHAYAPPLTEMSHYELEQGELRAVPRSVRVLESDRYATGEHDEPRPADDRPRTIDGVLAAARTRLVRLTPVRAFEQLESDRAVLVDIRPARQREEEGTIPGALLIERNVLEWRLDPTSPDRVEAAASHDLHVIVVCSEGYASSLAAESLQQLGLWRATDIAGGFRAWRAAGLPTVGPTRPHHGNVRRMASYESPEGTDDGLVTTDWLEAHLGDPDIRAIESNGNGARYATGHIPGAMHVDWVSHSIGHEPDAYVSRAVFDELMSRLGAAPETTLVLYGDEDNQWASYALAVFQLFGHTNLKLLQGGRAAWVREGRPLTTAAPSFVPGRYLSALRHAPERVFLDGVLIAMAGRLRTEADARAVSGSR